MGIKRLSGFNAELCWISIRRNLVSYVKKNNISIIHAHFANPNGFLAYKLKEKLNIPYIMHLHGRDVQEYYSLSKKEQSIVQKVYRKADHVICNSNKTMLLLKNITEVSNNVSVIAFGINLKIQDVQFKKINNSISILSVGNLVEIKGIQFVLESLTYLKNKIDFCYTIIGDGPMMSKLKLKAKNLNLLDRVEFLGRKNHETVMEYMRTSDIFILPSYNEAFGVVYLEALSAGCSVVGVESQGCEDINAVKECIYLTKPKNPNSISETFLEIINNKEKRFRYQRAGLDVLKSVYSWSNVTTSINSVYEKLLKQYKNE